MSPPGASYARGEVDRTRAAEGTDRGVARGVNDVISGVVRLLCCRAAWGDAHRRWWRGRGGGGGGEGRSGRCAAAQQGWGEGGWGGGALGRRSGKRGSGYCVARQQRQWRDSRGGAGHGGWWAQMMRPTDVKDPCAVHDHPSVKRTFVDKEDDAATPLPLPTNRATVVGSSRRADGR